MISAGLEVCCRWLGHAFTFNRTRSSAHSYLVLFFIKSEGDFETFRHFFQRSRNLWSLTWSTSSSHCQLSQDNSFFPGEVHNLLISLKLLLYLPFYSALDSVKMCKLFRCLRCLELMAVVLTYSPQWALFCSDTQEDHQNSKFTRWEAS